MIRRLHPKHFRRRYHAYKANPLTEESPRRKRLFSFRPRPSAVRIAKRGAIIAGLALMLLWSAYIVFFSDVFSVKNVVIETEGQQVANAAIKDIFSPYIDKNLLLVNMVSELQDLREAYGREFQKIEIDRDFPDTILVTYTEFPQAANVVVTRNNIIKKYIVNSEGVIVRQDEENADVPYIRYMSDEEIIRGMTLFSAERLAAAVLAEQTFVDKFGMLVNEVLYYPIEREIHLKTERNFLVWIDMEQDVIPQVSKLKRALGELDIYTEDLEYIDLRIAGTVGGEKIIFKKR